MRAFVTELPLGEPARFNPDQLENLCNTIGEVRAETEVALALDRISAGLNALFQSAPAEDLCSTLAALAKDAELIGMATLARVAKDVLDCAAQGDQVAFHATLARLCRVGDRSMHAVWDLDEFSG